MRMSFQVCRCGLLKPEFLVLFTRFRKPPLLHPFRFTSVRNAKYRPWWLPGLFPNGRTASFSNNAETLLEGITQPDVLLPFPTLYDWPSINFCYHTRGKLA